VLPKAIREEVGLQGGTEVEVQIVGDHLEIEPVPAEVDFVRQGDFLVAVLHRTPDQKLTAGMVENTRTEIYRQREKDSENS